MGIFLLIRIEFRKHSWDSPNRHEIHAGHGSTGYRVLPATPTRRCHRLENGNPKRPKNGRPNQETQGEAIMESWQIRWRVLTILGIASFDVAIIALFGYSIFVLAFCSAVTLFSFVPCVIPWSNPEDAKVEIQREELELKKKLVDRELVRMGRTWELEKLEVQKEASKK